MKVETKGIIFEVKVHYLLCLQPVMIEQDVTIWNNNMTNRDVHKKLNNMEYIMGGELEQDIIVDF